MLESFSRGQFQLRGWIKKIVWENTFLKEGKSCQTFFPILFSLSLCHTIFLQFFSFSWEIKKVFCFENMSSKDREQKQTDDNKAIGAACDSFFLRLEISFTGYTQQLELHGSSYNALRFFLYTFVCLFWILKILVIWIKSLFHKNLLFSIKFALAF
jgi:hypothetical protein